MRYICCRLPFWQMRFIERSLWTVTGKLEGELLHEEAVAILELLAKEIAKSYAADSEPETICFVTFAEPAWEFIATVVSSEIVPDSPGYRAEGAILDELEEQIRRAQRAKPA